MYIEPPFNYTGSKFSLLKDIVPLMPKAESFVDLFSGGGSIYSNVVHNYEKVFVNDVISELMAFHQIIVDEDVEAVIARLNSINIRKDDPDGFMRARAEFNEKRDPYLLYILMMSCTNNMLRFNKQGNFNQTFGKRNFNSKSEEKLRAFSSHIKGFKDKLSFSSKNFKDFDVMPVAFYYIDPPYSNTVAGYNSFWNKDDDLLLRDLCLAIDDAGSKFMVSGVKDHDGKPCKLLEELAYLGYREIELEKDYNKVSRSGDKVSKEVIYINYMPPRKVSTGQQ